MMKQLEMRFYSREELVSITGRDMESKHFARDVKNDLSKWGYAFEWHRGQGVTITKIPTTAEERLAEIMMRQFGLDVQIEVYAFACFLYLMLMADNMPWSERETAIWERFEVKIPEGRLRRWASHLLESDDLHKIKEDRVYWRTRKFEGQSFREPIDAETDEAYLKYKSRRAELITEYTKSGLGRKEVWGQTFKQLWGEFGCCYYACPRFTLNAIGNENIDEVCELVKEICDR